MSREDQDPKPITVGDLLDAVNRAEMWLDVVKKGLATLQLDTPIALSSDDTAAQALRSLQPDFPEVC